MTLFPGSYFQPHALSFKSCAVSVELLDIMVECIYPTDDYTVSGFQMFVQQSNVNEVDKIYVSQAIDRQKSASVVVKESGTYQVTIFAIRGERGIADSKVEYIKNLTVDDTYEVAIETKTKKYYNEVSPRETKTLLAKYYPDCTESEANMCTVEPQYNDPNELSVN